MAGNDIRHRVAAIEAAVAEALRQQGADFDEQYGHTIAFLDPAIGPQPYRVRIDVTRLATDVERSLG